jgi:asparagine synthase (glutamine-hydrolysing)
MCGFAGEFLLGPGKAAASAALAMANSLAHRGPDEQGLFLSTDGRCSIAFRRLSIIDLDQSHQPMTSQDGTTTVAFNGEIYNYRQLRQQLASAGCQFQTKGDCEVLLHLWRQAGQQMTASLTGMFAFAIYDSRAGQLLLCRDRLGEKPLWYAYLPGKIIFASQARALLKYPGFRPDLNRQAIMLYLTLGYVPAPWSIWENIHKLSPGSMMQIGQSPAEPVRYWQPACTPPAGSRPEIIQQTRQLVSDAVRLRLASDVPLGALLSGGIDSSIVVSEMAKAAGQAGGVKTFTAGFANSSYDERPSAAILAKQYKTDHTELLIKPDITQSTLDDIIQMYDEPFADSSALPTHLICQAARKHITVALVGDGGDEVFAGYDRYRAMNLAATAGPSKYLLYRTLGLLAGAIAPHNERSRLRRLARFAQILPLPPAMQYFKLRSLFDADDLCRLLTPPILDAADAAMPQEWFTDLYQQPSLPDELSSAQCHDISTYLPDDLLVKTDIASMACSLELRAPLLDHNLVNWGLSLPPDMKISPRCGKLALREAFADSLPPELLSRPKQGFGVPLDEYLRGPLLGIMRNCFAEGKLREHGIIQPQATAGLLNDHLAGRGDHRHRLWALLVLERWLELNQ